MSISTGVGIYNPNFLVDLANGDVKSQCGANREVAGNMFKPLQSMDYIHLHTNNKRVRDVCPTVSSWKSKNRYIG